MCTSPAAVSGKPQRSRPGLAASRQPFAIVAITHELHGDPGAAGEGAGYPLALPVRFRPERRQPQRQRAHTLAGSVIAEEFFDVGARERIAALLRLAPSSRDEPRQAGHNLRGRAR